MLITLFIITFAEDKIKNMTLYGGCQLSACALPQRESLSSGGHRRDNSQESLHPDLLWEYVDRARFEH